MLKNPYTKIDQNLNLENFWILKDKVNPSGFPEPRLGN